MDWLLRRLADRMGVEPARVGEAITPQLRFEQPWSQAVTLLVVAASAALIIWLYRREGGLSWPWKALLAGLRISLVVLAVFMLAEAVLIVDRTGLPFFLIMVDDSASTSLSDQFADPKSKTIASDLARVAGKTDPNRLAVAQGLLLREDQQLLKALQSQHRLKLYLVSGEARPLAEVDKPEDLAPAVAKLRAAEPQGAQTRLGASVRQVLTELRGVPPSAILILSDGQTTDGETLAEAAEFSQRKGVPLFTVGLGDSEPARDLEVTELLVDDVVFADDLVPFRARIGGRGFEGQELEVTLKERKPGATDPSQDTVLETTKVRAPADGQAARVEINHRPRETGEITYVVEVTPQPRELQVENNRIVRTINVRKDKLKVLLVEDQPRYEFRYLKNFLEREETIELRVLLQSSMAEYSEQDLYALPSFPVSKDELFEFDVIIFGDVDSSLLTAAQMSNIAEFVTEKGGGLFFVAGERYNPLSYAGRPLEPLLPIELSDARDPTAVGTSTTGYQPALTAEGRTSPIFRFGDDEVTSNLIWKSLPELLWYLEAPRKKPAALVLAEHPTLTGSDGKLPVLLYQFVGSGKVMFSAFDDTWRWRFRVGDRYFGRYWIQSIRFLARSKLLGQKQAEISTDRRSYQRNQTVVIRVRFPNPALAPPGGEINVQVDRRGQGSRKLTLKSSPAVKNVFEGALPLVGEGEYEVKLLPPPVLEGALPTTTFRVDPPAGEMERITMNEPELVRASTVSGGKFYVPENFSDLLKDLPKPQKVPLDTDPPIPLWNTWPVLVLFLAILTTEWVLRKRKQLV